MTFVALLRGINVGGKNLIRMTALKECLLQEGFRRVDTYIQSGNVILEANDKNSAQVGRRIEQALSATFGFDLRIVLVSYVQLKRVVNNAPADWKHRSDLRRNVAFLRPPVTAGEARKEVEVNDGVDVVTAGDGVLYMSTPIIALKKSRLPRLVAKKIYRDMTIRNYNTCQKILALMETYQ